MEIRTSAIFGRSSFTFGRSRIIPFYLQVGALSIKRYLQTRPRNSIDIDEPRSAVIPVNASLWLNNWVGIKQSRRNHIILLGAIETRNGRPHFPQNHLI